MNGSAITVWRSLLADYEKVDTKVLTDYPTVTTATLKKGGNATEREKGVCARN